MEFLVETGTSRRSSERSIQAVRNGCWRRPRARRRQLLTRVGYAHANVSEPTADDLPEGLCVMETSGYSWFHRQGFGGRWTGRSDTDEFRLALLSLFAEPSEARMQSYQLKKRLEERSGYR
jgi:hypothetical protein